MLKDNPFLCSFWYFECAETWFCLDYMLIGHRVNVCHCSTPCYVSNHDWWINHRSTALYEQLWHDVSTYNHVDDPYLLDFNYED
jgi:hypothetical protein